MSPGNKIAQGSWNVGQYGYESSTIRKIFHNRMVVFIGDSVVRGMYKDFVKMVSGADRLLSPAELKKKGERSFNCDELIEGGVLDGLFNGKNYIEVREFRTKTHLVRFYFVTRVFYDYTKTILDDFGKEPTPDVVLMGSACWDVTRYRDEIKHGSQVLSKYKLNLYKLFTSLKEVLPHTMCIWLCSMPIGSHVSGGFLLRDSRFKQEGLRQDILEANYFSSVIARDLKIDTIDLHYFFRRHQLARERDGIHWSNSAHRNVTFMITHHVIHGWKLEDYKELKKYAVQVAPTSTQTRSTRKIDSKLKHQRPTKNETSVNHINKIKVTSRIHSQRYEPYSRNADSAQTKPHTVGSSFHRRPDHPIPSIPQRYEDAFPPLTGHNIPQHGLLDHSGFSYTTDYSRSNH